MQIGHAGSSALGAMQVIFKFCFTWSIFNVHLSFKCIKLDFDGADILLTLYNPYDEAIIFLDVKPRKKIADIIAKS